MSRVVACGASSPAAMLRTTSSTRSRATAAPAAHAAAAAASLSSRAAPATRKNSSSIASIASSSSRATTALRATSSIAAAAAASSSTAVEVSRKELGDGAAVELTVTVPPAAVEAAWKAALKRARKGANVPGFRKGATIPDSFLIDHVGGPAAVKALAAEHILRDTLSNALAPHAKNAIQGSERVTDDIDALAENLETSKPFSYTVTFEAMPEFKWKGAYKGLKIEVAAAGDEASIDAAAEAQFDTAVKEKSKLLLVAAARPEQPTLQVGDVAVIDFDVTRTVGDDEVTVPGAARAATQFDTATAEEALGLKGLVDGMVGMEVGAERAIPLTLPPNWMPEELAGAAVTARVRVRELLVWQLPEAVDDAWAEAAYPGSGTLAGLKKRLRDAVVADVESKTSAKVQEAITMMLARAVDAAVPESVLRELGEAEYQAELLELQAKSRFTMEQISRLATPQNLEKFISSKRDILSDIHLAQRAVDAIIDGEKLEVPEEEVAAELATARGQFDAQGQEFDAERLEEQVRESLKAAKVMDWLRENNEVVVGPPAPVRRSFG